MHISEGILPLTWAAATTAASLPFFLKGASTIKRKTQIEPSVKPMIGLMGSLVFVVSALAIPVPIAGTAAHPTGVGMAAILIGPFPTTVITGVVLLFQAVFLAHGGLTTWGANLLNMGVIGAFAAYAAFVALRHFRLPLWLGGALAGAVGDLATYGGTALTMALALHSERSVIDVWTAIFVAFMPTQIPLAILEAVVTAGMLNFVTSRRPDLGRRLGLIAADSRGG
ncbi:MAG: energy-coupling factor ABC transporter permease [Chloroflexi bacterium]|nr:energy-coupling factor ABC transporter permease [Chloroflexota bacterium]